MLPLWWSVMNGGVSRHRRGELADRSEPPLAIANAEDVAGRTGVKEERDGRHSSQDERREPRGGGECLDGHDEHRGGECQPWQ